MKVRRDAEVALAAGFEAIKEQYKLPLAFSASVLDEADSIACGFQRSAAASNRRDATDLPLVTLDPATSTDLDQAFFLAQDGDDLLLSYALSDVGAFVQPDSRLDEEAWERGVTIFGLPQKIPLYPRSISQAAASLLPDGPRPAILVTTSIDRKGQVSVRGVERVMCASRAKLAYDAVDIENIPFLAEFARRMWIAEAERGSVRVEFPQQEVIADETSPGGVRLDLRQPLVSESVNATLSLATNLALANLFQSAEVGLFRVMDAPTPKAMDRLRGSAHALGITWGEAETLRDLQRRMDPTDVVHQRFLLEVRRSGGRARYATFDPNLSPWHAAIAAPYVHATAPMRRLADRYVLDLACYVFAKASIPARLLEKIEALPTTMAKGDGRAGSVDRAVIDLIEAVSLQHRIGEVLVAEVVDADAGIVQTQDSAIRSRATELPDVQNGTLVRVRIDEADPAKRRVRLTAVP